MPCSGRSRAAAPDADTSNASAAAPAITQNCAAKRLVFISVPPSRLPRNLPTPLSEHARPAPIKSLGDLGDLQHHAKPRLAAHHPVIGSLGLLQREDLVHRCDLVHQAE